MTPDTIHAIRERAGYTQTGLARVLGLSEASGGDYVRALEKGRRSPSGALVRLLEMLDAGELPKRYL